VNLARHLDVNPEQALRDSNLKFIRRFQVMEQLLSDDDRVMDDCGVEVLEDYWQKAKADLAAKNAKNNAKDFQK
jgi:ATP diphosphatase